MAVETRPEQHLAWEARQRPRVAAAAALAGVLTLGAGIANGIIFQDAPRAPLLPSLARAAQPGPVGTLPSLRVPFYEFYDDRIGALLATSVLRGLGLLAMGWVLAFLARATRARRPELPRAATTVGVVGAVLAALATVLSTVASTSAVSDFLAGPRTVQAATEITKGSLLVAAQFIGLAGALALGLGFVLVALNAMRAGLLTRFLGVLGIITGVLVVIPIGSPLPIVQCFWLFAVAVLLLGRWPNGQPPAWQTGRAEPWPSSAQVREARREQATARRARGRVAGAPAAGPVEEDEPAAVPAGARPRTASKKRKRKRRD